MAFDTYDRSDLLDRETLERCDVYFKRSHHGPDLEQLPRHLRAKVEPFGLNYSVRTLGSTFWTVRHVVFSRPMPNADAAGRWVRRFRKSELYPFLTAPGVGAFESAPTSPVERTVCFQTRVWTRGELGPDSDAVNAERVEFVRALRRRFGDAFRGGIVPTDFARSYCPDDLARLPTRRSGYIREIRKALVAVYTRGLHHSMAFKLPEYLAASKCIVAEPFRNRLPEPLREGREFLRFDTIEDCVRLCAELLADPARAQRLREGAWDYYQRQVRPDVHLAHVLRRVLELFSPDWHHLDEAASSPAASVGT